MPQASFRRRLLHFALHGAFAALVLLAITARDRNWMTREWAPVPQFVLVLLLMVVGFIAIRSDLRAYRALKEARASGRWPLGAGYHVEIDELCDGTRRGCRLEIGGTEIAFETLDRTNLALAEVVAIRVRPSWIEIESKDRRFRVVPRSYADRERLLWELAYRRADAFEFAAEAPRGAATPSSASATDDVADLDRRMTGSGLGSALAGPMTPTNPAPPRKSGLGVGLFVPPPERGAS
jgi:hypothetical protein